MTMLPQSPVCECRLIVQAAMSLCGVLLLVTDEQSYAAEPLDKPNIVVIWGDDIGQSQPSCYTQGVMGYQTPRIDSIAHAGILFTDYYTRFALSSGKKRTSTETKGKSLVRLMFTLTTFLKF